MPCWQRAEVHAAFPLNYPLISTTIHVRGGRASPGNPSAFGAKDPPTGRVFGLHRVVTVVAKFGVGQIVRHKLFDYRGVIVDADPCFCGSDAWYEKMAPSRPPKDKPWYRVLMHATDNQTYVAERNLEPDDSGDPIVHPDLDVYFVGLAEGCYTPRLRGN